MRRFLGTLSVGLFLVSLAGCGNQGAGGDGGGGSGGSGGAAPAEPSFTDVYDKVLDVHGCVGSYCHTEWSGTVHATYSGLVGKPATEMGCEGQVLVTPGDPEHSLVYLKVTMTEPPCGKQMPMAGAPLPADQVELLRAWIAAGAPE